ncbi:hypothetical protein HYU14_03795 [Candidatus Woesearchaeota archaeon]|nr:hypothetical protein [Candidatus Woesearchaeota archaeon]
MKLFLVRCPHCHNAMKYSCDDDILTGKRKACVYCGKSFLVRKNLTAQKEKSPTMTTFSVSFDEPKA